VNGLAGCTEDHTYWELLSKKGKSVHRLDVGKCVSLIIKHALICHSLMMSANTIGKKKTTTFSINSLQFNTKYIILIFSPNLFQELAATNPSPMRFSL